MTSTSHDLLECDVTKVLNSNRTSSFSYLSLYNINLRHCAFFSFLVEYKDLNNDQTISRFLGQWENVAGKLLV